MEPIVYGLSNEQYHRGEEARRYLSSSQLKWYLKSPRYAKFMLDALAYGDAKAVQNCKAVADLIEGKSDALRFGSLFHDLMESYADHHDDEFAAIKQWEQGMAIFDPPVNKNTNKPYGVTSNPHKEVYAAFLQANEGKLIVSRDEADLACDMANSLLRDSGATSEQVRKLLRWGKPEVSHFIEYEGLKFKWRPDLESPRKIIDYKTIATDDLSERSINAQIAKYGYDISAAFYLFFDHLQTGKWKRFYWIFVSKQPPYDAVMVDASKWTYCYDPETDIVIPQVGAIKFKALLDLHIQCSRKNEWPGSEIFIPEAGNGLRIMCPTPPPWEVSNAANLLEQSFNE